MQIKITSPRDIQVLTGWFWAIHEAEHPGPVIEFYQKMPSVFVNVYKIGRADGGPEEGGWTFEYGIPATDWVTEPISCRDDYGPSRDINFDTATTYVHDYFARLSTEIDRAHKWCEDMNEGRLPAYSVNSTGRYRMSIENDYAQPWPEVTPHYE